MAIIKKPKTDLGTSNVPNISPAAPIASVSTAGSAIESFGKSIEDAGEAYFKQAEAATRAGVYADAYSRASVEFMGELDFRKSQTTDENGMPTFSSLVPDIGKIGNDIKSKYGETIQDEKARNKFNIEFGNFIANQQIVGFGDSRAQQIDYTRATLDSALNTAADLSVRDSADNMGIYLSNANDMIDAALDSGAISFQESEARKEAISNLMKQKQVEKMIEATPEDVLSALENHEFNLPIATNELLIGVAKAKIKDNKKEADRQEAERQSRVDAQQDLVKSELELGVIKGTAGEAEIEKAFANGLINPMQRLDLLKSRAREDNKGNEKREINAQIEAKLAKGESLVTFTSEQIRDHYMEKVKQLSDHLGKELTMSDKAIIAEKYVGQVKPFQKELEFNLRHGDPNAIGDSIAAFEFMAEQNPVGLDGMDKESLAIAHVASNWLRVGSMSAPEALRLARKTVVEIDDDTRAQRRAEFRKEDSYKPSDIGDEIQSLFDLAPWFGRNHDVDEDTADILRDLLEEAYVYTGDMDHAESFVKQSVLPFFGASEFNGGKFMFMPPEKIFHTYKPEIIRRQLEADVKGILPPGVTSDRVVVRSDDKTRNRTAGVSYALYYTEEDEEGYQYEVELRDENGKWQRWAPTVQELNQQQSEEDKKKFFEGIEKSLPSPLPKYPGTGGQKGEVRSLINTAASAVGFDNPQVLLKIAQVESGLNPRAKNPNSSASGLFQFTKGTWAGMVKKYGKQTGIGMGDRFDARSNAIMGALFTQDNKHTLETGLGRAVSNGELYLAHFLGAGGALSLLRKNPRSRAKSVLPSAVVRANRSFFKNPNITVGEFIQMLTRKVS